MEEVARLRAGDAEVVRLRAENQELRAQLAKNSQNSSKPPTSDPPGVERLKKEPTGRSPGGGPAAREAARHRVPAGRARVRLRGPHPRRASRRRSGLRLRPPPHGEGGHLHRQVPDVQAVGAGPARGLLRGEGGARLDQQDGADRERGRGARGRGCRGADTSGIGMVRLRDSKKMFRWWHRVRDGTLSQEDFQRRMRPVERSIRDMLWYG